ncbi:hypothetical protein LNP74_26345 [Klebsiella pneumoniae subsp. pneumoniae]|nr:hypothetical protein [Klebsiella pneumoniae subsp. pneumoniae]
MSRCWCRRRVRLQPDLSTWVGGIVVCATYCTRGLGLKRQQSITHIFPKHYHQPPGYGILLGEVIFTGRSG